MQLALDAQALRTLNDEIEVPLVRVLAKMEVVGVGVDAAELTALRKHLTAECDRLRLLVIEDAGFEFNINSTKQLGEVLFERLGLAPQKKTKTGYSTDARELEKLRGEHPIIDHLLDYREVEKLRSTYGEGLLAAIGRGDRIRATFNQTVARTGRLSSDAPNLHNIPRAQRGGAGLPQGVRACRRLPAVGGRLQPDRTALHRPSRRRSGGLSRRSPNIATCTPRSRRRCSGSTRRR